MMLSRKQNMVAVLGCICTASTKVVGLKMKADQETKEIQATAGTPSDELRVLQQSDGPLAVLQDENEDDKPAQQGDQSSDSDAAPTDERLSTTAPTTTSNTSDEPVSPVSEDAQETNRVASYQECQFNAVFRNNVVQDFFLEIGNVNYAENPVPLDETPALVDDIKWEVGTEVYVLEDIDGQEEWVKGKMVKLNDYGKCMTQTIICENGNTVSRWKPEEGMGMTPFRLRSISSGVPAAPSKPKSLSEDNRYVLTDIKWAEGTRVKLSEDDKNEWVWGTMVELTESGQYIKIDKEMPKYGEKIIYKHMPKQGEAPFRLQRLPSWEQANGFKPQANGF